MRTLVAAFPMALLLTPVQGCSGQADRTAEAEPPPAARAPRQATETPMQSSAGAGVTGLPHGQGLTFNTLDEYLAHLRKRGAYDVPYYEEVAPGVYQAMAGRGGLQPQRFTRAELAKKFGFPAD